MCERRTRKIKKGSQLTRLRESRRLQRLQRLVAIAPPADTRTAAPVASVLCPPAPPLVDKSAQCRLILELALKTICLMQKNSLIQQKIIDLQKETSEYVASVMNHPENKRRYMEHIRVYGSVQPVQIQIQPSINMLPKLEPKV